MRKPKKGSIAYVEDTLALQDCVAHYRRMAKNGALNGTEAPDWTGCACCHLEGKRYGRQRVLHKGCHGCPIVHRTGKECNKIDAFLDACLAYAAISEMASGNSKRYHANRRFKDACAKMVTQLKAML